MKRLLFILFFVLVVSTSCSNSSSNVPVLRFYSWSDYMDTSIIGEFEKLYHVKVKIDYFASNEEAIAKIGQQMKANQGDPGYDVFFPSDYMVEYMKNHDLLEKLDLNKMPNVKGNILPYLTSPFDPKHDYAVPYAWGTIGIVYNKEKITTPVDSWKTILEPTPNLKNQIIMIDSPKEIVGVALKYLGYHFNSTNPAELKKAQDILKNQSKYVLTYNGDAIQEDMSNNEAMMAVSWSAEAGYAMAKNPALTFVLPKEGSNLYMDEFVILKGTKNKELAQEFINFFYKDEIQLKNEAYMHMPLPSISAIKKLPKAVQEDTRWYPSLATIKKLEPNRDSSDETRKTLADIYTNIRS